MKHKLKETQMNSTTLHPSLKASSYAEATKDKSKNTVKLRRTGNKLIATLLMFTAVPFLAKTALTQSSTKAELADWKEVKANLETDLTKIASEQTNMNEITRQFYNEIEKLYNLIPDNTVDHTNTNKYIPDNVLNNIDKVFGMLCMACNKTNPRQEIEYFSPEEYVGFNAFYNFLKDDFIEKHKQEIESILNQIDSILIKYNKHNEQCQNKNASVLEKEANDINNYIYLDPAIAAEACAGKQSEDKNIEVLKAKLTYCIFIEGPMVAMLISAQKTWPILLQKIDAKIAELEKR